MKKIALIMEGWKRFITYAWPAGILQRIRETNEDVNLYIFNSSGDWSLDENYNTGEYNIHNLPDFSQFDGIILDLNNIHRRSVCEAIAQAAAASGKPVISIAGEIRDFYYVGIDNTKAITEMVKHLHQKHSCERFWFVMGAPGNYENDIRVQALKDYLQTNGIAYREDDFYYGNYEYSCGYQGFEALLKRHGTVPDAVVCANDNIAVGVCEAAKAAGKKVPDDFLVTGFDNFDKAVYYTPSITTVGHVREEVGYLCADIFLRLWQGQEVPRFNYTEVQCVFSESCGCVRDARVDRRAYARNQIVYGIETSSFEDQVIALEYELMRCKTVREMIDWIPKCIPAFQCDAMYLIMDDKINDFWKRSDYYDNHFLDDDEFMIDGYPNKMNVEFAYEDGKATDCKMKQVTGLFPLFEFSKGATDFLFLPLHFGNRTIGYFAIRNAIYLMEKQYLFKLMNVLTSAIENLHKKEKLSYLNQELSRLYVKDALTGLYNRMGYQKIFCRMFKEKKDKKEDFNIMFMDMDRLKYINDNFGHEYGDISIKLISQAIKRKCRESSMQIRMGGDEFLVSLPLMEQEKLDFVVKNIKDEISRRAKEEKLPFEVSVSVGIIRTDMQSDKTLDDYVREADEVMYSEKIKKKAQRR